MSFLDIAQQVSNVQGAVAGVRNIGDFVLSLFGVDVVGVFDNETFAQLFNTARPMKANVSRQQKIMDHPIESGAIVSDFAIFLPVGVELQMMLTGAEYKAVYHEIKTYYQARAFVAVQTNADTFSNMLIEGMPHEESPDMFDAIPLTLQLREVQLVTVQYQALPAPAVQSPVDQSTVNRGVQQPKTSILYDVAHSIKNLF